MLFILDVFFWPLIFRKKRLRVDCIVHTLIFLRVLVLLKYFRCFGEKALMAGFRFLPIIAVMR